MTSRDLTESVEQYQVLKSLALLRDKAVAVLLAFARRAQAHAELLITARTHNVPAQPTTLGRRMAMFGEEHERACRRLEQLLDDYPARGLKGAVGTQLDQLTLLGGDQAKVQQLERRLFEQLGFKKWMADPGQVYPRSLDFEVVSALLQAGSAPSSFARTLRLMAGHELAAEGFARGQVGSSAMPHKMNSRSCERINGLHTILRGHVTMAAGLAGDQWNEGDVSCSVVRRVCLPDSFFALDGLLETCLVVLEQMEVFPEVIRRENADCFPFLATTTILMEAVQAGAGRESAHEAIKEHAVAAVRDRRQGRGEGPGLIERLAGDSRVGLDRERLEAIVSRAERLTGTAVRQVQCFAEAAEGWAARYHEAAQYRPGAIL
jgi:adenylosuccinate lyase